MTNFDRNFSLRDMAIPGDPIYLDYHSTTPLLPEVFEAMRPYFLEKFGNASSRSHAFGWQAAEAVDQARASVASLLDVPPGEITFTSGATEGINFLLKGMARGLSARGRHIVTCAAEHPAVLDTLDVLARDGYEVSILMPERDGRLDIDRFTAALRPDTIIASVMWANNETGVISPMESLAKVCRERGVMLISDATQAVGKITVHPKAIGVDAIALSAHKFYGPKGVGAVWVDPAWLRYKPAPLLHGGGHERGLRSGTLNVPGIVGLGAAAALRAARMEDDARRIGALRDRLEARILAACPETVVNGLGAARLPTATNLMVRFTESQAAMSRFRHRLAISSGSACSSANPEPSHVLRAMGLSVAEAKASYRFSLGAMTTEAEVDAAADLFAAAVTAHRAESPVWQMFTQGLDVSDW
jgi:cysteine desulfurase